jgi:hypothetical protein
MPDSISQTPLETATVVNLEQRWEVTFWTREFGICEEQLREVMLRVGDRVDNVRRYIDYIESTSRGCAAVRHSGWRPQPKG